MFSSESIEGLELERKYCKYVLNRWVPFRNIVAWEYNGEQGINCTNTWLSEIDGILDHSDPYSRPHTVSFWSNDYSNESQVNYSSAIDFTDDHFYPTAGRKLGLLNNNNEFNVDSLVQLEVKNRVNNFHKIAAFGEFGQESETWDWNKKISQHNYDRIALWSAYLSGAFPIFWTPGPNEPNGYTYNRITVDYLDYFYRILTKINNFQTMNPNNQLLSISDSSSIRAYCLANDHEFLVYIHHYVDHSTIIQGKTLSISMPVSQYFKSSWFDPATGHLVSTLEGATGNGVVSLTIPDFVIDIVLYLRTSSNFPLVLTEIPDVSFPEDDTLTLNLSNWYSCVEDPDDPDSTLNWAVQGGKNVFASSDQGMVNFFARQNWFGIDTLSVIVSDEEFSDTTSLIVHVQPINDAPMIVPLPDTTMSYNDTLSINLNEFVVDVDDADTSLTWSAVSSNDSLFVTIDHDNKAHLTALKFVGKVAVEFTVQDDSLAEGRDTLFVTITAPTLVSGDQISQLPTEFSLFQNYPNPFNLGTIIKYELPNPCQVSLRIYNCLGEEVATLMESDQASGRYKVVWQAEGFPSGIYFVRFQAGKEYIMVRKLLLLK